MAATSRKRIARNRGIKFMHTILIIVALGVALYLVAVVALFVFQRNLIYHPDTTYYTPADAGLTGVQEVTLATLDGERLIAWWAAATPGRPTILYFHGNGGSLIGGAERIQLFSQAGFGVFMLSYRSYSGSTGKPSERALVSDAILAYEYLRQQSVSPEDVVVYGESLGSGVAVQLAVSRPVGAVILDAPYTSLPDIGKSLYPFMPVETFMTDRFESRRHIEKVKAPILILHGTKDRTIPIEFGRALFEAAPEPKEFAAIEGAGHSNIYSYGAFAQLQRFVERFRQ